MQDRKAEIWNARNSGEGEPYKKHITDPIILDLIKPLDGKVVLEQGCGNGHLAKKISALNPSKIILLDFFESNLEFSKKNLSGANCALEFVKADLNKQLPLASLSVDVITSSMVLSEIEKLDNAVRESNRVLKKDGTFVISIIHPTYCLKKFLFEKLTGKPNKKIIPAVGYFSKSRSDFILGLETHEEIRAPHYNRTIQEYTDSLLQNGFSIERIIEPEISNALLKEAERFKEDLNCPISLIIQAKKR